MKYLFMLILVLGTHCLHGQNPTEVHLVYLDLSQPADTMLDQARSLLKATDSCLLVQYISNGNRPAISIEDESTLENLVFFDGQNTEFPDKQRDKELILEYLAGLNLETKSRLSFHFFLSPYALEATQVERARLVQELPLEVGILLYSPGELPPTSVFIYAPTPELSNFSPELQPGHPRLTYSTIPLY